MKKLFLLLIIVGRLIVADLLVIGDAPYIIVDEWYKLSWYVVCEPNGKGLNCEIRGK